MIRALRVCAVSMIEILEIVMKRKMNKKRGYFIHDGDPSGGFAVVATSLQDVRGVVYRAGEIDAA